jgi:hypothetical protein
MKRSAKHTGLLRKIRLLNITLIPLILFLFTSCFSRVDVFEIASSGPFHLLDVQSSSNTGVQIYFSNELDPLSAESAGNYTIQGLKVISARRNDADFSVVDLTTFPQDDIDYSLTVSGLKDSRGLSIGSVGLKIFHGDIAPCLKSTVSYGNTKVVVYFSEAVDSNSAENPGNYSIPGLSVVSATMNTADPTRVNLETSSQADGVDYTIIVSNVMDMTGNYLVSPFMWNFYGIGTVDTTSPKLLSAMLIDSNTVELQISEPVELSSSQATANYLIEDAISNPQTVTSAVRQADITRVRLNISGTFSKSLYYVTVSPAVRDLGSNLFAGPPDDSVSFAGEGTSILDVKATLNTKVRVFFSNDVSLSGSQTVGNYSIPGLNITNAVRDSVDFSIVDITTAVQEDINYTLTVSGFIEQDSAVFGGDVAPYIVSVSSYSNTEVSVYYSEPVEITSAEKASNYSIVGLTVFSAVRNPTDDAMVILSTSSQMNSTIYTLMINSVTDMNGNTIKSPNFKEFYGTGAVDNTKPTVLSAELIDSDTVEVTFSEPVEPSSSQTASNYTIKDNLDNILTVSTATRQADKSKVWVDIAGLFSECLYTVIVDTNVTDMSFNSLQDPPDNKVSFAGQGAMPESFDDGPVMVDPMAEGTNSFSLLTKYRGRIYLGPAKANNAVFRLKPDGSDPELVSFTFHVGMTYSNSLDPGPDGEDGIDYVAGGIINGTEHLFIGPANSSGNLDYIYFTSDNGSHLNFDPMDLGSITGGATEGVSSMIVFNDNLYIGYPDDGGKRPYLHKIVNIKQNPVVGTDVLNLNGDEMPRIGKNGDFGLQNNGSPVGIDSFGVYGNRLYLANGGTGNIDEDGGILASTNSNPLPYNTNPGDWSDITPISKSEWYNAPFDDRFSLELPNLNKLIPAEKAFPAMAVFNNRLYVIRNTDGSPPGPQLWKYDGFIWSLVADNGMGLSDMGNPNNKTASLLVVNGDRLYIGYDNSGDGIHVWRTMAGVTDPVFASDFEPVSTDGFGDPANNETIFHGLSIPSGGTDYLWLLSGKSGGSIRFYRTQN